MTIPTFMANTAGAQFRTGFKKGITVLTQAASANYATEGYDFGGTNGAYGASTATAPTPTSLFSATTGLTTIGFDTPANAGAATTEDRHPDTPSLFHLFQSNLNMKNSREITNYAVMPAEVSLNCLEGASGAALTIPGVTNPDPVTATAKNPLGGNLERTTVSGAASGIQTGGGLVSLCNGRALNGEAGGINQGYMFQLEDGMVFTYDPAQAYCSESNPCFGYIDVNGPTGPNCVISCSENGGGDAWITNYGRSANSSVLLADCTVDAKDITDIYPVLFYGSTVKPASIAAKSVLYSKKSNQTTSSTPPAGGDETLD